MTTADQLVLVERRLGGEVRGLALCEGGLVQGWIKTRRLLVLAKKEGEAAAHALLVFVSASYPVSEEKDLGLETAMKIDTKFR